MSEEIKDAIRRRTVDREKAKAGISFLGQPMGRALHAKLKTANENWKNSRDDATLVEEVASACGAVRQAESGRFAAQAAEAGRPGTDLLRVCVLLIQRKNGLHNSEPAYIIGVGRAG